MKEFTAILLMGGQGLRVKEPVPKQFLPLGKKILYQYALETFSFLPYFEEIILVSSDLSIGPLPKNVRVVKGGSTRQESSFNGLLACKKGTKYVVIHDAARPFVTKEIIKRNIEALKNHQAVNTCIPSPDTINSSHGSTVEKILDRKLCYLGQTPQSFSYPLILDAHEKTNRFDVSDDCALILEAGHHIQIVLGSPLNFKITTPFDLELATFFLERSSINNSPLYNVVK